MVIKILAWFGIILCNVYLDRKGAKRNYFMVFGVRGIAAILHGAWMLPSSDYFDYSNASSFDLFMVWMPILIFQVSSYWIIFELVLNLVRGNSILYYDQKEGDSGWIDRFFKWAGPTFHAVVKLHVAIIMILSIVSLFNGRY